MATAARFGIAIDGAMLYTTLQPCFNCLKELMQVRLRGVVFRREWQAGHPDYAWVADEYERLVEHYRSPGQRVRPAGPGRDPPGRPARDRPPGLGRPLGPVPARSRDRDHPLQGEAGAGRDVGRDT